MALCLGRVSRHSCARVPAPLATWGVLAARGAHGETEGVLLLQARLEPMGRQKGCSCSCRPAWSEI